MSAWLSLALDVILIGLVIMGLVQAGRLLHRLADLRQGRLDMERFVQEFSATVLRAELGIKGLKQAARESGDDLEKLIEKAGGIRDELQFITESADQIASRLSQSAQSAMRAEKPATPREEKPAEKAPEVRVESVTPIAKKPAAAGETKAGSRAEKELLQALEKLG